MPGTLLKEGFADLEGPISPDRISQVPPRFRGLYRRLREGKSRKVSIRCFCLECMGWDAQEVERCTARDCPLWRWRLTG